MTSVRAIAANRANAKKSRGPRTRAGKQHSSRNATRHGLSSICRDNPKHLPQIEQMAKAICFGDTDPRVYAQAIIIAESELILICIREERAILIEKWRNPLTPLPNFRDAKRLAKCRIQQRDLAYSEFSQLKAKLVAEEGEIFTLIEARECKPDEPTWRYQPPQVRDEYDAMHKALPELERLHRYEKRALSRRKKAISMLAAIRVCASAVVV